MSRATSSAGYQRRHRQRRTHFAHGPKADRARRIASPTQRVLATRRVGGWTYVLMLHAPRGYPPSARVGRTRTEPERFRMFGLQDEYRVFRADTGGVKAARSLYRRIVGSADPAATWTAAWTGGEP